MIDTKKILDSMSVEEKAGQLMQIEIHRFMCSPDDSPDTDWMALNTELDEKKLDELITKYHIGFVICGATSEPTYFNPGDWEKVNNKFKKYTEQTKLKIPVMFCMDIVHGFDRKRGNCILPHCLGVAATWNPELYGKSASFLAREMLYEGINLSCSPNLDIPRDIRWGRTFETFGEDPLLVTKFAEKFVDKLQSGDNVSACAKHYVGYGEGQNGIDRAPVDISERRLREIHLPPYKNVIDQGVDCIMVSSGEVNGVPMHINEQYINAILRDEYNFQGLVITDWNDINKLYDRHKVVNSLEEAIIKAFNAGIDVFMLPFDIELIDLFVKAVYEGKISMERLDISVKRVLDLKNKLGLLDSGSKSNRESEIDIHSDKYKMMHRENSLNIALESIVLLKNSDNLLPLHEFKSILVSGNASDSLRYLCGGWTVCWQGTSDENLTEGKTIYQSIKNLLTNNANVDYIENFNDFEADEKKYDAYIVTICEEPYAEWIGDTDNFTLRDEDDKALNSVISYNKPIVLVIIAGRPIDISKYVDKVDAIIWANLPGTFGGEAIAQILMGQYNPSGKLPITYPKDVSQLPLAYNDRNNAQYEPLFPFGYGLSYTRFVYSDIIVPETIKKGNTLKIKISVQNAGQISGQEVVQVYLIDVYASVTRPRKQLIDFKKLFLESGEKTFIDFEIKPETLSIYDCEMNLVEEKRSIIIIIGNHQKQIDIFT